MYLILPSNTPALSYPENKSSSFTVPLSSVLVTKNCKVGLVQIQLPITFYNVETSENVVVERLGETRTFNLEEGIYEDPQALVSMLQKTTGLRFTWLDEFKLETDASKVIFSAKLARLLSFPLELSCRTYSSNNRVFDPWINLRTMFVHCSLGEMVQVNNSQARVLRAVVLNDFGFGRTSCFNFFPVEYLPVQGDVHTVIVVTITDSDNEPIKFRTGNVVLQLELLKDEI